MGILCVPPGRIFPGHESHSKICYQCLGRGQNVSESRRGRTCLRQSGTTQVISVGRVFPFIEQRISYRRIYSFTYIVPTRHNRQSIVINKGKNGAYDPLSLSLHLIDNLDHQSDIQKGKKKLKTYNRDEIDIKGTQNSISIRITFLHPYEIGRIILRSIQQNGSLLVIWS